MNSGPVAVLFDRFGPYHCARLRAAARGMDIVALELCGRSQYADWESVDTGGAFARVTLFPDRDGSSLSAGECRREVFAVLDTQSPAAVAVPGWGSTAARAALSWCAERGRPAVVMSESTAWDKTRFPGKEAVKRRVVRRGCAAGLVGGQPQARYLADLGMVPAKIFQGYDVVDNDHFVVRADAARADADARRVALGLPGRYLLTVCRLAVEKNLLRLVEAYAAYRAGVGPGEALALVILGEGPLRTPILSRCRSPGLEGSVLLPGFKQYDELPAYYALADGFVLPSIAEPWGLVVNEAMACGLPVLVSERCGCAADLVAAGDNGWTFDPHDLSAIAAGLRRLAGLSAAERTAMGRRSRERIARWSPQLFAESLRQAVALALSATERRTGRMDRWLFRGLALLP